MNSKNITKINTLYYIHDPICSWCYAFKPILKKLRQQLPEEMEFSSLLGGLAPDTDLPMPAEMRQQLQATWQRIEQKVPSIQFNYNFWANWQQTHPRRSTYPACRAVIAAHIFDHSFDQSFDQSFDHSSDTQQSEHKYEELMIDAIQTAYYQNALNPSNDYVLIKLATDIGLDKQQFQSELQAKQTQLDLEKQITQCRQMNALSYPTLILKIDQSFWPVSIDYLSPTSILETIQMLLEFE